MMIICSVNRERPELDRKWGTDEQTEIQCADLQKLDTLDDHLPRREVQRQIWKNCGACLSKFVWTHPTRDSDGN